MPTYALDHISDAALLADLSALVSTHRQTTAALLAHLAEVDARGLYLPAACTSMHAYCMRVLHFAKDAAFKRICAARVARRFPQIFDMIADGRLHLSGLVVLSPHLTDENVDEVLAAAAHGSKAALEMLVARLAPKPDLPTAITPIGPLADAPSLPQLAPGPVAPPHEAPLPRVKPLASERFAVQVTIGQATRDKLERAQALLRHRNPSGDLAGVLDRALDALLVVLEREKFGATSRPRARRARAEDADPRYIANEVRREVHARDGEQCAFVSEEGVRCTERGFLEFDHRTPVALGGKPTVDKMRLLCRAHNQYEAERLLGADFMRAKRPSAQAARTNAAAPAPVEAQPSEPHVAEAAPDFVEADVVLALRGMGFKADEARRAMTNTAPLRARSLEDRLRAALADLTRSRGFRCSDGAVDASWARMASLVESIGARVPCSGDGAAAGTSTR